MKYFIIILLTVTFSNTKTCNNKNASTAKNIETSIQEAKNMYYINTLNGKDVVKEKLYITFDEERNLISGYSGCNTFSSKYTIVNDQISLGFPIASKIYCEEKMVLEQGFFKALLEIKTKTITGKVLSLKDTNGNELLSGIRKD
ncbi:META domain-containing protein [Aquimarina gracilis]|uniref:META domain-containing protein n=1 Tax=Aquimarina gracilis TaxID=874422 RepID=A0ABU5ZTQ6_9FLAO|nr:META domain-containing protein [Aquimarina gracilis]MEB3345447.1 META domain-containing protein [Aquimarina gracilis]